MQRTKEFWKVQGTERTCAEKVKNVKEEEVDKFADVGKRAVVMAAPQPPPHKADAPSSSSASTDTWPNAMPETPAVGPDTPKAAPILAPSTPMNVNSADSHVPASPMGSPESKLVQDTEYIKTISTLIQHINKAHVEWARRSNEFQLTLTKSKNNQNTKDSTLEHMLVKLVKAGEEENMKLRAVEEKFVLSQLITQDEQIQSKQTMAKIVKTIKDGQKLKLRFEGVYIMHGNAIASHRFVQICPHSCSSTFVFHSLSFLVARPPTSPIHFSVRGWCVCAAIW